VSGELELSLHAARFFQYGLFVFRETIWEKPYRETRLKRWAALLYTDNNQHLGGPDAVQQEQA